MVKPHQANTKAMDFSAFHSNAHKTQLKSDVARRLFRIRFSFAVARSLVPICESEKVGTMLMTDGHDIWL